MVVLVNVTGKTRRKLTATHCHSKIIQKKCKDVLGQNSTEEEGIRSKANRLVRGEGDIWRYTQALNRHGGSGKTSVIEAQIGQVKDMEWLEKHQKSKTLPKETPDDPRAFINNSCLQ